MCNAGTIITSSEAFVGSPIGSKVLPLLTNLSCDPSHPTHSRSLSFNTLGRNNFLPSASNFLLISLVSGSNSYEMYEATLITSLNSIAERICTQLSLINRS